MFTTQNITTSRAMQCGRNTHLFKTALNLLGEISWNSGKIDIWSFFRSTKTCQMAIYITKAVVEADSIDYTRPIWLADNAM